MEDLIEKSKTFVKKDKSEEWEKFVRTAPNAFPYWTAVMHSISILESMSKGEDFGSVSLKIGRCSDFGAVRSLVFDIVVTYSNKGDEFADFIALKQ